MNKKFLIGLAILIVVGIIFIFKVNSGNGTSAGNTAQTKSAASVSEEFNKGMESFKNEKYSDAISYFDKAISKDSSNALAYYYRGNVKYRIQDIEGAYIDVSKAYELEPHNKMFSATYENIKNKKILGDKSALQKAKEAGLKKYGK